MMDTDYIKQKGLINKWNCFAKSVSLDTNMKY